MADRGTKNVSAPDANRGSEGRRAGKAATGAAGVARLRSRRIALVWQLCILVMLIAGMKLLNTTSGNLVMPSPEAVFWQSVEMWSDGTIPRALGESFTVLGLGFVLAASSGILIGILLGGFPFLGRVLDPYVNAVNATPSAAFIPLVIVWFGLYIEAKVVLVWLAAVFPILINTTAGIANANKDLVEMAESFGAPRRTLFWQVMVPDALPSILSGLRIGAAICIVGTVIAELTMAQSGLGGLMIKAGNRFQMDRYFAVVLVMMALGSLITIALRLIERQFGRWRIELRDGN
ncbi:ABC transporter permease [Ponticoccus sp. SC2-23]|uniref:ABC transporter permease n=1 Tax=Alexandriicola marinus TaxID=2081710 RepID=UPI000FD8AAA3|nr:ABC transporter permease [Alexandriicola marinus]MBM1218640.1 ABC transporter permease [Ponticoccus sp. SC6-9]MBM1224288.1 ABC transporter permease [Ponticoccus sp. SC6-15]MBM1229933.1 ABC transporter permease [Ponticoccus sp. SC6-38]MBM1233254.1 ABC transporter permease [Ponticoccus sp. SC6-45]MBM1236796.1 ABC transporter permease [Ponticoccus sp. SC6-49]MBM1242265.1 ABC transporter permease [Ponticoccus sp. SC2-64]MBM1246778.1 ABC transporter permease [Ponticoccus sp. SC6-42]MBM1251256